MVDRPNRLKAAGLIEQFVNCDITNFQFQDRFPRSNDPALHAINTALWFSYSDVKEHRLNGKHALWPEARNVFDRCVLFLRTETEYTGIRSFVSLAAPFKRLWNLVMRKADPEMPASWPFDSTQELDRSRNAGKGFE